MRIEGSIRRDGTLSTTEAAERVGITYRQMHYLIDRSVICVDGAGIGSGNHLRVDADDFAQLQAVARVQKAFRNLSQACGANTRLLRLVAEHHADGFLDLEHGVRLTWADEP